MSTQSDDGPQSRANRLARETSPYLLQHARNPVDWYPWGPEALERARQEERPILLSIGYSACHWCHVMERESFEDPGIAEVMNRHFVCIKVDREERPDLDEIYMQATLALNQGQGGWPMTVFLTPDQRPFFAGTYFPPEDRYGRPGFRSLLEKIGAAWRGEQRQALVDQGARLTERLRAAAESHASRDVAAEQLEGAVVELAEEFDPRYGGFGPAPKFPPSGALMLLLRHHRRVPDEAVLRMITVTLDAMAHGGMYDQIGGGFCRYSTDEAWLVPHFEKMLYDNAELARVYLQAWQVTQRPLYERVAREILDYVVREMTAPGGGYFCATDADSEGVEGKFFVWTPQEIRAALEGPGADPAGSETAELFCDFYDIAAGGNWEGKSIPNVPKDLERFAQARGLDPAATWERLRAAREQVYAARARRVPPGLDDKILTSWNALMIGAMCDGYRALGERRYLDSAAAAAAAIATHLTKPDGRLLRTRRGERAHLDAVLEDYAYLADALLDLYEAGGRYADLQRAVALGEIVRRDFRDGAGGGLFTTAHDHEPLIVRRKEAHDGAIPNPTAVAARALCRLGHHTGDAAWGEAAREVVRAYGREVARFPRGFTHLLGVVDLLLEPPLEIALALPAGQAPEQTPLWREVGRRFLPNAVLAWGVPGSPDAEAHPLLRGKTPLDGGAAVYVCRDFACRAPVSDPAALGKQLDEHQRQLVAARLQSLGGRLEGAADSAATAARARRLAGLPHGFCELGRTHLTCSRLGFGGYRVDDDDPEHEAALRAALAAGCNLIDTSTNYTDGDSEALIGRVLHDLIGGGGLRREEVIVVSKVGYVQGQNLALAQQLLEEGRPFPDMVRYNEGCWHDIHPEFIADQLERSLRRLGLETLDVLLLHNPEYFFTDAQERGRDDLPALRQEFDRRLRLAFAALEEHVKAGRISWYGVSSNTAAAAADDFEATSLTRMLELAREVGGPEHHFAVVQLPMNLVEAAPATVPKDGPEGRQTVLEHAREQRVGVLVNRPLNAVSARGMQRLADPPPSEGAAPPAIDVALAAVAKVERELRGSLDLRVRGPDGKTSSISGFFGWAEELGEVRGRVESLDQWEQIEHGGVRPQVARVVHMLDGGLPAEAAQVWARLREPYLAALDGALRALRADVVGRSRQQSEALHRALAEILPLGKQKESLARKALWTLASTPGVSSVLNGMRRPPYVEDSMGVLAWSPLADVGAVYETVRQLRLT